MLATANDAADSGVDEVVGCPLVLDSARIRHQVLFEPDACHIYLFIYDCFGHNTTPLPIVEIKRADFGVIQRWKGLAAALLPRRTSANLFTTMEV